MTAPQPRSTTATAPVEGSARELTFTVRVFTYPRNGRWYAEATELSLMAEGVDEHEAVRSLIEQAVAYVRTAVERGWLDQLHRPASLRHRLDVAFRVKVAILRRQHAFVRNELVRI